MAKKKKKSVLDYDPLAWLNDSNSNDGVETAVKTEEVKEMEKQKQVTKKAVKKKSVKKSVKKAVKKKSVKKAVKKKAVKTAVKKKVEKKAKVKETSNITSSHENDGFGFFADEDKATIEENTELEDGFGFFEQPNLVVSDEAESLTVDGNAKATNEDDEGFGFFSDEDLEAVNTQTLDITKDEAINLGSELTIKTVSEVKEKIANLMAADIEIVINAEEMIKIDTAGLQLLYSLKEALNQTGHHIKWIGTSTVINDSAEIIGMPLLAPKSKEACFGFFEENNVSKDADDGSSGFF